MSLAYLGFVVCTIIVGGCVGGLIGKFSIGKMNFVSAAPIVFAAFIVMTIGNFCMESVKRQPGNDNLEIVWGVITLISAILSYIGARRGPL